MSSSATATAISFAGPTSYITTPLAIPGCAMWLDAADSATVITNGSNVTQWNDKSGNGYNVASNSNYFTTTLPTYSSNTANKYVQLAPNQALCSATYNYTTAWSCFVCMNSVFLGGRWLISPFSSVGIVMMGMNQGNNKILGAFTTNPVDITGNHIQYTSAENTNALSNLLYYRNGTIQASNITNRGVAANASAKMGIGANATLSDAMTGTYQVYEIVIYNRYLTTVQRQQVEGYLGWKWGLQTNLATSHPYANSFNNPGYFGNLGTSIIQSVQFSNTLPVTTGLALWLDAADSATIQFSSGANVSNWRDKSGNGRNMTTQGNSSFLNYTIYNNFNSIFFNNPSVNNVYMANSNFPNPASATIFIVFASLNISQTWNFIYSWRPPNSSTYLPGLRVKQSNSNAEFYLTWFGQGVGSYPVVTSGNRTLLFNNYINTTNTPINISINGGSINSQNIGQTINQTVNEFNLGADLGGNYANMYVNEVIMYSNVLSITQRQQVESYLAWKWGLQTNLPTTHPYYNNATFASLPPITRTTAVLNAGFTPTSLSGLALWLDAADAATVLTSNSSVTQWNDKSGNGRNMSNATLSNTPTYNRIGFNNLPTISFSPTIFNFLQNTSFNFNSVPSVTLFIIVQRVSNTTTFQRFFSAATTIGGGDQGSTTSFNLNTSGANDGVLYERNNVYTTKATFNTLNPSMIELIINGSSTNIDLFLANNNYIYRNGSLGTSSTGSGNGNNFNLVHVRLGNAAGNSSLNAFEQLQGNISEVVMFNRPLNLNEFRQVEGYLAWKWSLTGSLPASHPNKYMPP